MGTLVSSISCSSQSKPCVAKVVLSVRAQVKPPKFKSLYVSVRDTLYTRLTKELSSHLINFNQYFIICNTLIMFIG